MKNNMKLIMENWREAQKKRREEFDAGAKERELWRTKGKWILKRTGAEGPDIYLTSAWRIKNPAWGLEEKAKVFTDKLELTMAVKWIEENPDGPALNVDVVDIEGTPEEAEED